MQRQLFNCRKCQERLSDLRFAFTPGSMLVFAVCLSPTCPRRGIEREIVCYSGKHFEAYDEEHPPTFKHCMNGAECVHELGSWQPATPHFFNTRRSIKTELAGRCKACLSEQRHNAPLKPYWQRALTYWNNSCAICGFQHDRQPGERHLIHEDHWHMSKLEGGKLAADNSLPLCATCNVLKSDRDSIEWLMERLGDEAGEEKLIEIEAYFEWAKSQ